jgi:Conjugal transfer protein TraD
LLREWQARTRRLIEYGGLVAIVGVDEEDKGTVLGLLLEGHGACPWMPRPASAGRNSETGSWRCGQDRALRSPRYQETARRAALGRGNRRVRHGSQRTRNAL